MHKLTQLNSVRQFVNTLVTFDSDGGTAVESQTVNYNSTATKPANPTKTGYVFEHWYYEGDEFSFATPIVKNINLVAKWKEDLPDPIGKTQKSDGRFGIRFTQNIVNDKAEISIVLPNNERAVKTEIVVYDAIGNIVFVGATALGRPLTWDLTNSAGRTVANGTYLVIAEVKSQSGMIYHYSAKLGVKK